MVTAYITAPPDAAADIAETLVDERLAACVNFLPCRSVYRWEGAIHDDEEVVLLAKTTAERYDDLAARVLAIHPYEVPCVERFEDDPIDAFAEWRRSVVE